MAGPVERLTSINLDDLATAFGVQNRPTLDRAVRHLFHAPARKFAQQMLDFDSDIGRHGLSEAARLAEQVYAKEVVVINRERLPTGPFLALSNHPGMTDTLAVMAALERSTLKVIALNRPFLLSLPNLNRRLFFVTDDPGERVAMIRQASRYLRGGGALLTFPAGHNEPDPDVYPGAVPSLRAWTENASLFLRLAPETAILPVAVRHVIWEKLAHHPILHIKKKKEDRELLAVALQLLIQVMFNLKPVRVMVQFGRPITFGSLGSKEPGAIHQAVLDEMKQLIENPPEGPGKSIL